MTFFRRTSVLLAGVVAVLVVSPGGALAQADCDDLPRPTGYIVDEANRVDASVESDLAARLQAYEASTAGNQVAALVVASIGDREIEDYANDVFDCWGVGKERADTGVLLVVALEQRRLRIEVGRGLEGDLTDVQAADIIRDVITPRFRDGDVSGGVQAGVVGILTVLGGGDLPRAPAEPAPTRSTGGGKGFGLLFLLVGFAIVSSLANRGRRGGGGGITGGGAGGVGGMWLPILLGSSGRGGWSSGSGGGSSGGGFGGGGFGGFGGGGSGGGGASGGW